MPPPVARELSITYAGVTVGGASEIYLLDGPHTIQEGYESATLTCTILCVGATEAAFATNVAALEDAFRTPRQALTVTQGAVTLKSWSHSGSTGFYSNPSIRKLSDAASTGRSRRYEITITVNRPADLAGQGGRLNSSSRLVIPADGKRNITITGRYTATSGGTALANYTAGIAAFQASVITLLASGVTFELANEERVIDDANKFCDFTRSLNQIDTQTDQLANVTNHQLILTRSRTSPGSSYQGVTAKRLVNIAASFRGGVMFGVNARQIWDGTIVPWIMGKISSVFGISGATVMQNTVNVPVRGGEPLTGNLVCVALDGSNVVEFSWMFEQTDDGGKVVLPAWDPDPHAAYVYAGPRLSERTLNTRTLMVSNQLLVPDNAFLVADKMKEYEKLPEDGSWISLPERVSEHPYREGVSPGPNLDFIERTTSHQQRYVVLARSEPIGVTIQGSGGMT